MLTWIIGSVVGWGVKLASNRVLQDVVGRLAGGSDNQTRVALAQVEAEVAARANAREIRLATASFWEMRLITFIIAACFTSHLVLVTLDTDFKLGWKVPAFPSPFDEWQGVILLSFFGVQLASKAISTIGAVFMRK